MKFGTSAAEHQTWWSNAAIPVLVADRYRGVPTMVYSTGNVYPLSPVVRGGSVETDDPGRSEERRVGKECRSRRSAKHYKKTTGRWKRKQERKNNRAEYIAR